MRLPVIALRGVTVTLGRRDVLRGVSVDLPLHGMTFIIGPSGSGKSTLCRAAVGLVRPSSGSIEYLPAEGPGLLIDRAPESLLGGLRRRVPFVVQAAALLDWLSLWENVALAARAAAPSAAEADEAVARALASVGLAQWAHRRPGEVGPGIRKRAAIARALVLEPTAVVLDEPTTGLDQRAAAQVVETLVELGRRSIGVIAVSHDIARLEALAEHVIEVRAGRVSHSYTGRGDASHG